MVTAVPMITTGPVSDHPIGDSDGEADAVCVKIGG
jgi:hypothetical protein